MDSKPNHNHYQISSTPSTTTFFFFLITITTTTITGCLRLSVEFPHFERGWWWDDEEEGEGGGVMPSQVMDTSIQIKFSCVIKKK